MPGKVKVKIVAGRNLPVMDRSSDTTDAYVEIKLGNTTFKTDVCRKSLNPQWNSEWYRFEMDDAELQDEPLQIRLMDHDTYSANDAIGKVYLDLNPLLLPPSGTSAKTALSDCGPASNNSLSGGNTMTGWFPVYDTMHGIRGEVNVIVKVELFSDFNKFRQSSCGVQFYNSSTIPHGYHAQIVHGMVEELVVSDDPEYQWIDKIRTPRASNEARQTLFFKLSGEVQRKIGLKVLDFGGNAVVGYLQCFDLEAECGIVVRGLGTAVSLVKLQEPTHSLPCQYVEDVKNPVLSVIPASPLRRSPASPFRQSPPKAKSAKGFLAPGSPRNRRSKSPQVKQPFSDYKPKRLGTYTRSFSDNISECDNDSLKVLFEQEDMRGEPVSSRKKLFHRLSSFPKRKFRALRASSGGGAVSQRKPFVRSKSENVASSLIRSLMDTNTFSLDRVSEAEEISDSKLSDRVSVIHQLRYDDGHLVSMSSSSSDISTSDIGDISDVSSVSTITQEFCRLESGAETQSKLISLNSKSISFDTSVTSSKVDDDSEKDEIVASNHSQLKSNDFESTIHVVLLPENDLGESQPTQFSQLVTFDEEPLIPKKSSVGCLVRQVSYDASRCEDSARKPFKRSDTPPLSEMDPYMKFSFEGKDGFTETFFGPTTPLKVTITQPSLDDEIKSRPVNNLSFPESIRQMSGIALNHINSTNINNIELENRTDIANISSDKDHQIRFDESNNFMKKNNDNFVDDLKIRKDSEDVKNDSDVISPNVMSNIHLSEDALKTTNSPYNNYTGPNQEANNKNSLLFNLPEHLDTGIYLLKKEKPAKENLHSKVTSIDTDSLSTEQDGLKNIQTIDQQTECDKKEVKPLDNSIIYKMSKSNFSERDVSNIESFHLESAESCRKEQIQKANITEVLTETPVVAKNLFFTFELDQSLESEVESNTSSASVETDNTKTTSDQELVDNINNNVKEGSSGVNKDNNVFQNEKTPGEIRYSVNNDNEIKELHFLVDCEEGKMLRNEICPVLEINEKINSVLVSKNKIDYNENKSNDESKTSEKNDGYKLVLDSGTVKDSQVEILMCEKSVSGSGTVPVEPMSLGDVNANQVCGAVTSNLSIPHHPLVKSRSASGLCQSSIPPSRTTAEDSSAGLQPVTMKQSQSPLKMNSTPGIHRRSSDSDLSITPKGNSLTSSGDRSSMAGGSGKAFQPISSKLAMKKEPIEAMEFPFLTMSKFPAGFIVNIAGTVTSRSVKLLERVTNQEEPESRDAWWTELRMEVRSHMRAMSCNAVVGYSENTTICDDVCVLSASGTAAIVNVRPSNNPPISDTPEPPVVQPPPPPPQPKQSANMTTSLDRPEFERNGSFSQTMLKPDSGGGKPRHPSDSMDPPDSTNFPCAVCHLPFNPTSVPLPMTAIKCGVCGKKKVPDLLLATIEPLEGLPAVGRSCLIHVFVTRPKQHARGEMNACIVSDSLPFIEYDIYKQLVNKLKVNGMNALFGLKTQICLGERMIAAVTSGTAMFLEALPPPSIPIITPGESWNEESKLASVLKGLQETVKKNRDFYQVKTSQDTENNATLASSDTEDSDDDLPDLDIHAGNKEACVFMVDDEHDIEVVSQLIDPHPPEGFFVTATEGLPGMDELEVVRNLQMFTQIWRSRISSSQPTSSLHKHFHKLLQGIYYKLRRMTPCAVGNIKFRLALPEPDEMQISIVGMAVGLGEGIRNVKSVRRRTFGTSNKPDSLKKSDDGDMIFPLEEDQETSSIQAAKNVRPKSPVRPKRQSTHMPPKERYGVDITPLSYIPGGRIERYLGNLNFFFIRETSCIREGGGLSGFVHSFVAEVLAIIRAHVTALGGNALVAFFLNECIILNNPHKNHGQCLINVGGDAVSVSYLD